MSSAQARKGHAFAGFRPWLITLSAGVPGPASREARCKAGAVIYSSPGQGTHGRQHPAEEVIRVLPGAGGRERVGGRAPFPEL